MVRPHLDGSPDSSRAAGGKLPQLLDRRFRKVRFWTSMPATHILARFELWICNPPLDGPALSQGTAASRTQVNTRFLRTLSSRCPWKYHSTSVNTFEDPSQCLCIAGVAPADGRWLTIIAPSVAPQLTADRTSDGEPWRMHSRTME